MKAVVVVGGFSKVFEICASEGRLQLAKYVCGNFKLHCVLETVYLLIFQ